MADGMQVPNYGGPKVSPEPYPNIQSSPDDFGAAIGRALIGAGNQIQQTGSQLQGAYDRWKGEVDGARVMDAYSKYRDGVRKIQYGDPDKGTAGIFSLQGADAVGSWKHFQTSEDTLRKTQEQLLKDPKQVETFNKMVQRSRESDFDAAARHEADQGLKYKGAAADAMITSATQAAINGYTDESIINKSIRDVKQGILVGNAGQPAEIISEKQKVAVSALHTGIISRTLVEKGATAADEYYERHKNEIWGVDHTTIQKAMEPGRVKEMENQFFNGVTGKSRGTGQIMSSVIQAESSGQRGQVSPKGAVGLAQVMPATAREMAVALGNPEVAKMSDAQVTAFLQADDPASPGRDNSVRYGDYYLQKQLEKYNGDVEAALVAYNAGPGNADKWLNAGRDYKALPKPQETLPYVQKIIGNLGFIQQSDKNLDPGWATGFLRKNAIGNADNDQSIGGLTPMFQSRLATMLDAMPENLKGSVKVFSGYRDQKKQAQLWRGALLKYGSADAARKWVAPPSGTVINGRKARGSQHGHGSAVDLRYASNEAKAWVHANAGKYGLAFPLGNEDWHIEPMEARANNASRLPASGRGPAVDFSQDAGGPLVQSAGFSAAMTLGGVDATGKSDAAYSTVALDTSAKSAAVPTVDPDDLSLDDALASLYNSGLPDDSVTRLERRLTAEFNRREARKNDEVKAAKEAAWKHVQDGNPLDTLDDALSEKVGPEFMSSLMNYEAKTAKAKPVTLDPALWAKLTLMSDEEFKNVNMVDLAPVLPEEEWKKLVARQAALLNPKPDDIPKLEGQRSAKEIGEDTLKSVGIVTSGEKADNASVGTFFRRYEAQREMFYQEHKRSPTAKENQEIADRLVIQGKTTGGFLFWGGEGVNTRAFQAAPDELKQFKAAATFEDIPDEAVGTIGGNFQQFFNRQATPEEAVDWYNMSVRANLGDLVQVPDDLRQPWKDAIAKRKGASVEGARRGGRYFVSDEEADQAFTRIIKRFLQ